MIAGWQDCGDGNLRTLPVGGGADRLIHFFIRENGLHVVMLVERVVQRDHGLREGLEHRNGRVEAHARVRDALSVRERLAGLLVLSAADGYADVLLGEQTRRRGKALAEALGLKLDIRNGA